MFRRVAHLPVDCSTDNVDANQKLEEYTNLRSPDAEERDAKRRKMEEVVKENIEQAKLILRQETWCWCLVSSWDSCEAKGLQQEKEKRWLSGFPLEGPYTITASLGKGLYRLKEQNGEKVHIISCTCDVL